MLKKLLLAVGLFATTACPQSDKTLMSLQLITVDKPVGQTCTVFNNLYYNALTKNLSACYNPNPGLGTVGTWAIINTSAGGFGVQSWNGQSGNVTMQMSDITNLFPNLATVTHVTSMPGGACTNQYQLEIWDTDAIPSLWGCVTGFWNRLGGTGGGGGGGANTPATTNVLRGNGAVNSVVAAVPGVDYMLPLGYTALSNALNLSDLSNAATARTNLGLGTSAIHPATDFILSATLTGTGAKTASSTGITATGDCAMWDASGNVVDAGVVCAGSGGGGTVTSFTASPSNWPSWLMPTVTTATSTPSLRVTAGSIPVTALNGGSGASSTTYWRGDGTWATPAGGGGGSGTVTSFGATCPTWLGCSVATATTTPALTVNPTGTLPAGNFPVLTGDVTTAGSSLATTLASIISTGSCGDATHSCGLTLDTKGRVTGYSNNIISGGGGGGSGVPNYSQSFTSQTSVTLTHGIGTTNVLIQCKDTSNNLLPAASINITNSTSATVTFLAAQSGTCVVNGSGGGLAPSQSRITATGTIARAPYQTILCNATSANVVATFPTTPSDADILIVSRVDTSANSCSIAPGSGQTFAGSGASITVASHASYTMQYELSTTTWWQH